MKKFHTCPRYTPASLRYTATPARLAAPAERERADPAAGRLTASTARYTALWPRYTASGGADGDSRRRNALSRLRAEAKGRMESRGVAPNLLLGHPGHLGFMGLNGPTHEFFFFFYNF
jgi:hypothetical protein